ncbi:antibiotic biosynthesis monooxygenase [Sphingomonas sp. SUN019]|uniref:antibiotic biosynthesis monooxygenase family protein n=1 Tax=Sphingomonas sp. SUN019 TaxID=2937788 RepID=UPI002164CF6A|nr:antibiotic biosynthesis monooxygenase [Sphingomonas sp. SUN019]UVO50999.1 antibiotic biosynthesis monooxygenase [Sphingomonas sp. SUN019]
MILEHAVLSVKPGQELAFEAAMREARALIAASPGFGSIIVRPAIDQPETYLLLVEWSDIAAHRDGFRMSDRYEAWRGLLHQFYDPMPVVSYFEESIV